MDFFPSLNWIFTACVACSLQFKLGKNPVDQTRNFKLENVKNQVQIDRRTSMKNFRTMDGLKKYNTGYMFRKKTVLL